MTSADDVRRVGLALPRAYEREIRGHWKIKVRQLVFVAFSADEQAMGFGFPRTERDGLVASDPETFFMPRTSDLRYQWVCAHLPRLGFGEMRELVTEAWRMCVPKMLHDLPELPEPTAALWSAIEGREWSQARSRMHPRIDWRHGDLAIHGRPAVLEHLRRHPTPRPPTGVEVREGQVWRWTR